MHVKNRHRQTGMCRSRLATTTVRDARRTTASMHTTCAIDNSTRVLSDSNVALEGHCKLDNDAAAEQASCDDLPSWFSYWFVLGVLWLPVLLCIAMHFWDDGVYGLGCRLSHCFLRCTDGSSSKCSLLGFALNGGASMVIGWGCR